MVLVRGLVQEVEHSTKIWSLPKFLFKSLHFRFAGLGYLLSFPCKGSCKLVKVWWALELCTCPTEAAQQLVKLRVLLCQRNETPYAHVNVRSRTRPKRT